MKKIKVLFVLNSLGTGGSERVVLDICKGLDKNSFEPFVLSLNPGELTVEFEKENIYARSLDKKPGVDTGLMIRAVRIVKDLGIDVINAHHFSPCMHIFPASLTNRVPLIYTDHTVHEISMIPWYWVMIGTLCLKDCYGVLGISHACTKKLVETFRVPAHKAFTLLNATNLERFDVAVDKRAKRASLGLKPDEKIVGIVGNLREQKNHANILKAFSIIRKSNDRIRLLVIGEGPMRDELTALRSSLGLEDTVAFLGARLDVSEIFKIMDAYCLCSHYEGLPLTILEAMASKVPIAATDVVGINDVVTNGVNGLLVRPDNPDELASAIVRILDNPELALKLSETAYNYVFANHSMGPWIRKYEELFMKAAASS